MMLKFNSTSIKNNIFVLSILLLSISSTLFAQDKNKTYILGNKRELFVDKYRISKMHNVNILFHHPVKQKLSKHPLKSSPFMTVIKVSKNRYIAYYRANNPKYKGTHKTGYPDKLTKYAISKDGINWSFPKNNIIIKEPPFTHNFSPFLDKHENINSKERFKALAGVDDGLLKRLIKSPPRKLNKTLREQLSYWGYPKNYKSGLYSFVSQDGVHWKRKSNTPVITVDKGVKAFDSQNVSFWSEEEQCYVCFFRTWEKKFDKKRQKSYWVRQVSKTTSADFMHWSKPIKIEANLRGEQLYTTQTHPYFNAPHIYISLPTRFMSHRKGLTDIMFMTMRAGNNFFDRVLREAYIRPGMSKNRWKNRANYVALNVIPTSNRELSIYHSKSRHRYTLRIDGFASIHAGEKNGFFITKPFLFNGNQLFLNYSTSAAGSIKIELEDLERKVTYKSITLVGDAIDKKVIWQDIENLNNLSNKKVRLKFMMKESDIYSYRFINF